MADFEIEEDGVDCVDENLMKRQGSGKTTRTPETM